MAIAGFFSRNAIPLLMLGAIAIFVKGFQRTGGVAAISNLGGGLGSLFGFGVGALERLGSSISEWELGGVAGGVAEVILDDRGIPPIWDRLLPPAEGVEQPPYEYVPPFDEIPRDEYDDPIYDWEYRTRPRTQSGAIITLQQDTSGRTKTSGYDLA